MRVLQVNSVCGRGSTGRIAVGIAERLRERGDDCKIAYGRQDALGWDDTYRIGTSVEVIRHQLATRLLDQSGFRSEGATKRFLADVEKMQPDLIHLHNVHGYYLDIETLFAWLKSSGVPVVWTLHDVWSFTGHCAGYESIGCYRWQDECGNCPQRLEYPRSWVLDRSRENLRRKRAAFTGVPNLTVVTPSRWLADQAGQSYLGEYDFEVVPNEVDAETFRPTPSDFRARHGIADDAHVVLAVANAWGRAKGLHHVQELAGMLHPDERLVVLGLAGKQVGSMPDGVVALERTASTKELAQAYSAADVFINPTHEDISSLTNLEAVSVGLPVVTFRTGGAPETVEGMVATVLDDRTARGLRAGIDEMRADGRDNVGVMQARYAGRKAYEPYLGVYDRAQTKQEEGR